MNLAFLCFVLLLGFFLLFSPCSYPPLGQHMAPNVGIQTISFCFCSACIPFLLEPQEKAAKSANCISTSIDCTSPTSANDGITDFLSVVFKGDNAYLLVFVSLENISCVKHDLVAFWCTFPHSLSSHNYLFMLTTSTAEFTVFFLMIARKDKFQGYWFPWFS